MLIAKVRRLNAGRYGIMYGMNERQQRAADRSELMREWQQHEEWTKEQQKLREQQAKKVG